MKFNITISEQDYIKFNVRHLKYSKLGKTLNVLVWVFAVLLTAFAGQMFFTLAESNGLPNSVPVVEIAVLVVILIIYMLVIVPKTAPLIVKWMLKVQKKDGKLPYSESCVVEIKDDEIIEESSRVTIRAKYDELAKVYYFEDAIYLYINSQQAIILPYNQLGEEKVIAFLKDKIDVKIIGK